MFVVIECLLLTMCRDLAVTMLLLLLSLMISVSFNKALSVKNFRKFP